MCCVCAPQSTYAVVEFANKESITSLYEGTAIPTINHEAMVPFKSRLLSLRSTDPADLSDGQSLPQYQPQTTIPIGELIQRLSKEESVSVGASSGHGTHGVVAFVRSNVHMVQRAGTA